MKITVAGTGNVGSTLAADLSNKGHSVTLLKTSDKINNEHFAFLCKTKKILVRDLECTYEARLADVVTNVQYAISSAELVIICIQTNYHEQFIKQIAPYIHDGQIFIIEPGYLSTCYFLKYTQKNITVIEAESSPIDCRITAPGQVNVLFKNVRNPFGIYPVSHSSQAKKILDELEYPYALTNNVIEAALHNPNLIVHTIGSFMSIPRIEYSHGNYWMYKEVFTPHVWNLVESLDNEKMDILEHIGCKRIAYVDACKFRNSLEDSRSAKEIFFDYAMNSSPRGPFVPDSRYITEDVSQGLVMLESLGQALSVPTPICSSLINLASAALKRDFRENGRKVEQLGVDHINKIVGKII